MDVLRIEHGGRRASQLEGDQAFGLAGPFLGARQASHLGGEGKAIGPHRADRIGKTVFPGGSACALVAPGGAFAHWIKRVRARSFTCSAGGSFSGRRDIRCGPGGGRGGDLCIDHLCFGGGGLGGGRTGCEENDYQQRAENSMVLLLFHSKPFCTLKVCWALPPPFESQGKG